MRRRPMHDKSFPHDRQVVGKQSVDIHVGLPIDNGLGVSPTVCTQILIEIIKYVVYQKQQIPYPYLHLKDIATKFARRSDEKTHQKKSPISVYTKQNRQAALSYKSLEEIFQNLEFELKQSSSDDTQEVVVLMGATPMSPQDVYHIQLPVLSTALCDTTASYRQSMMVLIRSLTASTCLNEIFSKPMAPTNTYVLLKKKAGGASKWFLPKDRYSVPTRGNQVFICLQQPFSEQKDSMCSSITPAFENIDLCNRTNSKGADFLSKADFVELNTSDRKNTISCMITPQTCDFHVFDEYAARKSNIPSNLDSTNKIYRPTSSCNMTNMPESGRKSLHGKPVSEQLTDCRWYQCCTFLKGFK